LVFPITNVRLLSGRAAWALKTGIPGVEEFLPPLRLLAWAGACAAVPVAAYFASMSPPWPAGIVVATSVAELAAVWFVYRLLRGATRRRAIIVLFVSALGIAQSSIAYLTLHSLYTFEIPATKERSARGFVCTFAAKLVHGDKCPDLGKPELEAAHYSAVTLWTFESINIVRVNLAVLWSLAFAALSVLAGTLAALRSRNSSERRRERL
jgi:hypothetical protein